MSLAMETNVCTFWYRLALSAEISLKKHKEYVVSPRCLALAAGSKKKLFKDQKKIILEGINHKFFRDQKKNYATRKLHWERVSAFLAGSKKNY